MKLAIIIVSYNVRHYLQQCLDSLYRAVEGIDAEIYVIDNHSKDNTVKKLKGKNRGVKFIACNHNHGFAKANNMGIRRTKSEYVLLLNPDTIVGENTLKECIRFMDEHENAGGLGVRMLKCNGSDAMESRRGLPTPMTAFYKMCGLCAKYPTHKKLGKYYMGYLPWDEPAKIEIISGAFMMMRRTALDKAGLLDEDFFMYGEDIDLSYRLLKSGFDNWYLPTKILHYKGESTQKSSFKYVHVFYEAMLIFFKKHYGHLSIWLNMPIKAAIYLKATTALIKTTSEHIQKTLGFMPDRRRKSPLYIFISTKESISRCRSLADRNGLDAQYIVTQTPADPDAHAEVVKNISCKTPVYLVYDTGLCRYEDILNLFSKNSKPNVKIGTYSPRFNIIITDNEIIA